MMMRRQAREAAFKLIYAFLFTGEAEDAAAEAERMDMLVGEGERGYLDAVYRGIVREYEGLYALIDKHAVAFRAERLYKADLAVLLLAAYEILHLPEIPAAVSANEAVELAKLYCSEKSPKFINGVLAGIIKEAESL